MNRDHSAVVRATRAALSSLAPSDADWASLCSSWRRARVRSRRAIAASSETHADADEARAAVSAAASGASSESRCAHRRRSTPFTCSANPRAASRCPLATVTRATHTLQSESRASRGAHLTIDFDRICSLDTLSLCTARRISVRTAQRIQIHIQLNKSALLFYAPSVKCFR